MSSLRKSAEEQYKLIMECRSSGLSDHQWCLQHDINPGTFYNWVSRLRAKKCYDIPNASGRNELTTAVKQDVVKVEILQKQSDQIDKAPAISLTADAKHVFSQSSAAPIEIQLNEVVLRITNDIDPRLLSQILKSLGGSIC